MAIVAAMPTIASIALPPSARIVRPVSAARTCGAAAAAREKEAVRLQRQLAAMHGDPAALRAQSPTELADLLQVPLLIENIFRPVRAISGALL